MLLAGFMKMNPDLLQVLPTATPSAPLMLRTVASRSLLNGSNSQEEVAAQLVQHEASDPILSVVVPLGVEDDTLTSSAMHLTPAEVTRPKAASVVLESPTNLEIDALEIGGGSDELGFSDAGACSNT